MNIIKMLKFMTIMGVLSVFSMGVNAKHIANQPHAPKYLSAYGLRATVPTYQHGQKRRHSHSVLITNKNKFPVFMRATAGDPHGFRILPGQTVRVHSNRRVFTRFICLQQSEDTNDAMISRCNWVSLRLK